MSDAQDVMMRREQLGQAEGEELMIVREDQAAARFHDMKLP
jgi:hypothetical protein